MLPRTGLLRILAMLALSLCAAVAARGQAAPLRSTLIVEAVGRGTLPVDGVWQFRTGDDPAWASPTFDDSEWQPFDISRPWGNQGHWNYAGYAWYRRTIDYKSSVGDPRDLWLYMPVTSSTYEIFWNGKLIGQTPYIPGQSSEAYPAAAVYPLGKAGSGVLAIRAYTAPLDSVAPGSGFGIVAIPRVGGLQSISIFAAHERSLQVHSRLLTIAQLVIYGQFTVLGAIVWLRNRSQKLLFWMFAFLLSVTIWVASDQVLFPWQLTNYYAAWLGGPSFHTFEDVAVWYLLLYLLNLDRYPVLVRWTRILAWTACISEVLDTATFLLTPIHSRPVLFQVADAVFTVGFSLPEIFPLVLVAYAFRRRMDPARWFFAIAAIVADMYFVIAHTAGQGQRFTQWTLYEKMTNPVFSVSGIDVTIPAILNLILVCAIVYAVYRYMIEQGQRQAALEQEYHNARSVQQVIVPEDLPSIPGFSIDSVYQPFGEVGGDFFQIIPLEDGGLIAAIGDVSGKGLPAALTVSLLVGTIRTLVHYTASPAAMLEAMNQRMIGRSQGGFTTCLVLRLDNGGTFTAANAGHLPPYLAGTELSLESGLPLGLVPDSHYVESSFRLTRGEQLTLMTDGVIEARDAAGELFGFDRTTSLSTQSAEAVAEAAQAFGQDDDITVLTLVRV